MVERPIEREAFDKQQRVNIDNYPFPNGFQGLGDKDLQILTLRLLERIAKTLDSIDDRLTYNSTGGPR